MPRMRFDGLWRHADFRKLWAALTIDQFGAQITFLATQLTAVTFLGASALQMTPVDATGESLRRAVQ